MVTKKKKHICVFFLLVFYVTYLYAEQIDTAVEYIYGKPILKEDFENSLPHGSVIADQLRPGFWNLRIRTWGGKGNKMLNPVGKAPDLTYDPKLNGIFDVYLGLRSVDKINTFGIKLSSEDKFVGITAPYAGDTHRDFDFCWKRNASMDGEKIVLRSIGFDAYIDHIKFIPVLKKELNVTGQNITICRDDSKHLAFPGVAQSANGDILVVFREGLGHVSPEDYGKIALVRSKDLGKTWSRKVYVYQEEKVDARDPSILCLSDGTLVITCTTKIGPSIIRSYDNGYTWDQPNATPVWSNSNGLCQAPDGRLFYVGYNSKWNRDYTDISYSDDHGKTWYYYSTVTRTKIERGVGFDPALNGSDEMVFDEPAILILPDGRWIVMFRVDIANANIGYLRQFTSSDYGKTWSGPEIAPMWGLPPHLMCLKDGNLLCSYGFRRKPFGVRACISRNQGISWDISKELILRADGAGIDLGYPESIELADGRIFTVYYMNVKGSNCFIAGNFYRINN